MKRAGLLSVHIALFVIAATTAGNGQTLRDAVARALDTNPETLAAESSAIAAKADTGLTRGELLPKVILTGSAGAALRERDIASLSSNGDWLYARELRLSIIQQLYDGGKDRARINAAREAALAAEMMRRKADNDVALGTVEAYIGVLRAQALIDVAEANVAAHREALSKARKQAEIGGDRSDRALVSGRLGLAQSILVSRRAVLRAAEIRFERFVGFSPQNLLPFTLPNGYPMRAEDIDTSDAPEFLIERHLASAASHEVKAIQATWSPEISAEARGGIGENVSGIAGADNEAAFFVTFGWTFFDRARDPSVSAARERANQALESAENAKLIADESAARAWTAYQAALRQGYVLQRHASRIREVGLDFSEQFGLGRRSLLNVLDIRNEQFRADSALVDVRFQEKLAAFRLLAATGDLAEAILGRDAKAPIVASPLAPIAFADRVGPENTPYVEVSPARSSDEDPPSSDAADLSVNRAEGLSFSSLFKRRNSTDE
ncbi:MAG: TolC family protein [Verrucomicrobiota bacterium]